MAIPVGIERGYVGRDEGVARVLQMLTFLSGAQRHWGAFPHWIHGVTGQHVRFLGIHYKIGEMFLKKGIPQDALQHFQEVLKRDDQDALALEGVGEAYFRMGKEEEAEAAFRKAIALQPDRWQTRNFLGLLLDRQKRHQDAIAEYEHGLRVRPDEATLLNNLGLACRDLGVAATEAGDSAGAATLFEESWGAYSRAVEYAPADARIVNDRALIAVYYLDEHWDLAERELHRSIQIGTRTVINIQNVEGQLHGGIAMGLGYALMEEFVYTKTDSFAKLKLPRAKDMPEMEVITLKIPRPKGPFGASGTAEYADVPTAPAIGNAIFNACGMRVRDLPITPEKVKQSR